MYTDFIAQAYSAGYEFVTLEELASRLVAQQKAHIDYTTVGNAITATITPDPTAPDLGEMSLNVVNGGTQVIQNVTNWYAYNGQELFLPKNGGTFTVNLGATQDDVTHIASLPMRGDLLSVTGDGLNLSFAMVGAAMSSSTSAGPVHPPSPGRRSKAKWEMCWTSRSPGWAKMTSRSCSSRMSPASPSRLTRDRAPQISSLTSPRRPFRAH